MAKIAVIQGHPDASERHFTHALAQAYETGAAAAGHEIRTIDVATLEFPLLRSPRDFEGGTPVPAIKQAQEVISWADHIVIVFPLWLGTMPALLKGFLEQTLRPGFATSPFEQRKLWTKRLKGKSARLIVTMGMPGPVFRWFYRAHGVKVIERNMLNFVGIRPVRRTLVGLAGGSDRRRARWLRRLNELGRRAR